MRLIHTADWHLGRLFHNQHLTRDQEVVLLDLVDLVAEVKPHAVLIAGDLYDRGVPPTDAVELLDHVLATIVLGHGVPVVAIAGNHDSPTRLGFASALLREKGLHLVGGLCAAPQTVTLADEHGPVHLHALPFADPAQARATYEDEDIHDQQSVLACGVARALSEASPGERQVALAHTFVAGGIVTPDSERPLSVGGAGCVAAAVFAGFDYVALGHLHRPQQAGDAAVWYAGSLMKYSFAEHDHRKSVSVVEIGPPGSAASDDQGGRARVEIEHVALEAPHDVRRLEGTLAQLLERGRTDRRAHDYVLASLLDTGAVLDPIGQLRAVYPNVLAVERPLLDRLGEAQSSRPDPSKAGEAELFESFFVHVCGDPPDEAQRRAFDGVVDEVRRRQRESAS